MATFWIEEYANFGDTKDGKKEGITGEVKATQKITIGSSTASSALQSNTEYLVIHADAECYYLVGASPTALTTSSHLPANVFRAIEIKPGLKIAVVEV